MYSMGLLGSALTMWGGAGSIVSYRVRFTRQTWPGETLITRASVTAKRTDATRRFVDLECSLESSDGETKVVGTATLELE
jgi:acyl dehydratase